ncbi:HdeD family acid-resistance protein [Streptomyces sp. IB201691-2A2]|uniref:HdeD family acid-resistance protein n=1 Tax=Streptomyces sp. IB201691-2A2 TaxID=2561920 RepID=UPI001180176A|nr:HdeD family acid-resistance protein [Streptomyces sp. IB201691-2A2]TRO68441.1 HdeD family acid-resistance protein [Streptomyces sp. IB201691-2A2]
MTVSRDPAPHSGPADMPDGSDRASDGPAHMPYGAASVPAADPAAVLAKLGRSWTWVLGSAIATLVPGILILVWPDGTLHVVAVLIGLYLLVTGAFRFVETFAREDHGERLPGLLLAVLYVLGGVLCLRNPLQTIAALSLIVGIVWVVSGILTLYTALAARDLPHRGFVLGIAVIGIVAGIVVLALPSESARALTRLLGLWLVLLGLAEVALALAWRAALRRAGITGPHDPARTT